MLRVTTSAGTVHNPVFFMARTVGDDAISGNESGAIWAPALEDVRTPGFEVFDLMTNKKSDHHNLFLMRN